MTPAARTQAAIDVLDQVIAAAREGGAAADVLVARYFASRRYAGSKDRRAVRELVYAAIRACGETPSSGRAALLLLAREDPALAATFDGSRFGPQPIEQEEEVADAGVAPRWLLDRLSGSQIGLAEAAALVERAPLDLRINQLRAPSGAMDELLSGAERLAALPNALRLPSGVDVSSLAGLIEVQDAGSQAVTLAARSVAGMTVIDLCAGAGGKTLALAAEMHNEGRIVGCDVDRARLSRLAPRAAAAGVTVAETRLLDAGREAEALADLSAAADVVLVDAPCSGTGTWRRNPEARWRLSPARLSRLVATQAHVLTLAKTLVRPGGALVYVVCSLLDEEGSAQIAGLLAEHPGWTVDPLSLPFGRVREDGVRLTPAHDGTDGFFVARLIAPC